MENINFRGIPTSLFLNGPKLGIVTDPQSLSDVVGVQHLQVLQQQHFLIPILLLMVDLLHSNGTMMDRKS